MRGGEELGVCGEEVVWAMLCEVEIILKARIEEQVCECVCASVCDEGGGVMYRYCAPSSVSLIAPLVIHILRPAE